MFGEVTPLARGGKFEGLGAFRRFMGVFFDVPFIGEKTPALRPSTPDLLNEFSIFIVKFSLAGLVICRKEFLMGDIAIVPVKSF